MKRIRKKCMFSLKLYLFYSISKVDYIHASSYFKVMEVCVKKKRVNLYLAC